jgi:hypothetical protein
MKGHAPLSRFLLPAFAILVAGCASNTKIPAYLSALPSVIESDPIVHTYGIEQFGMPRDARFVFCDGDDCADRTLKHLPDPPVVTPLAMPMPTHDTPVEVKADLKPERFVEPQSASSAPAMNPAKPLLRKKNLIRQHRKYPSCKPG